MQELDKFLRVGLINIENHHAETYEKENFVYFQHQIENYNII